MYGEFPLPIFFLFPSNGGYFETLFENTLPMSATRASDYSPDPNEPDFGPWKPYTRKGFMDGRTGVSIHPVDAAPLENPHYVGISLCNGEKLEHYFPRPSYDAIASLSKTRALTIKSVAPAPKYLLDLPNEALSSWFIREVQHIVDLVPCSWAIGTDTARCRKRARSAIWEEAWPVMYIGPEEAKLIGWDRIRSTPARSVEKDKRGGWWIRLLDVPFVSSPEVEEAVAAATEHLNLRPPPTAPNVIDPNEDRV